MSATAVSSQQQLLRQAWEAVPLGVLVCDASGAELLRTARATAPTGDYQADALLRAATARVVAAAHAGQWQPQQVSVHSPAVSRFEISAQPLDGAGQPSGLVVLVADHTADDQAKRMRRDMLANLSHELRTPLGAIGLLTETLLGMDTSPQAHELHTHLAQEAQRAQHLVDTLLALSKVENPPPPDRQTPVAVNGVVAEAVGLTTPAAEEAGVSVRTELPAGSPVVLGEAGWLTSALTNLLDNSVKYSEPGATTTVTVTTDSGWCLIRVADQGIGIPARDVGRIFERFYRVDAARSRDTGGAGLGLAIVRHVVENHDGTIEVASTEGEGSQFTVRLPLHSPLSEGGST